MNVEQTESKKMQADRQANKKNVANVDKKKESHTNKLTREELTQQRWMSDTPALPGSSAQWGRRQQWPRSLSQTG
jgi:hypothetical protein